MHAQKMPPRIRRMRSAQSEEMKVTAPNTHIKPLTPMRIIFFLPNFVPEIAARQREEEECQREEGQQERAAPSDIPR